MSRFLAMVQPMTDQGHLRGTNRVLVRFPSGGYAPAGHVAVIDGNATDVDKSSTAFTIAEGAESGLGAGVGVGVGVGVGGGVGVGVVVMDLLQRAMTEAQVGQLVGVTVVPNAGIMGAVEVTFRVAPYQALPLAVPALEVDVRRLEEDVRALCTGHPVFGGMTVFAKGVESGGRPVKRSSAQLSLAVSVTSITRVDQLLVGSGSGGGDAAAPAAHNVLAPFSTILGATRVLLVSGSDKVVLSQTRADGGGGPRSAALGAQATVCTDVFRSDFDPQSLGVGGLGPAVQALLTRAVLPRVLRPITLALGQKVPVGVLLSGPPGCGKTRMACALALRVLGPPDEVEPKRRGVGGAGGAGAGAGLHPRLGFVNGSSLLDKYVGESERKTRELFEPARREFKERGPDARLYIIIMDEIDALGEARGAGAGGSSRTENSVLTQLLTQLDGGDSVPNVLLIGLTNRPEALDPALTRPGRLEIHVAIGLPTDTGRQEILQLLLADARRNGLVDSDVDLAQLAADTPNFTGADLAGLVRLATSLATSRAVHSTGCLAAALDGTAPLDDATLLQAVRVGAADFDAALARTSARFCARPLASLVPAGGSAGGSAGGGCMNDHTPDGEYAAVAAALVNALSKLRGAEDRAVVLVHGPPGCGKSALVATAVQDLAPPIDNQVLVTPGGDLFPAGAPDAAKCRALDKVLRDAALTPEAVVVLENVEMMLEWSDVRGMVRFNAALLTTLVACLSSVRRVVVILTSRNPEALLSLGLLSFVDLALECPPVLDTAPVVRRYEPSLVDAVRDVVTVPVRSFARLKQLCRLVGDVSDLLPDEAIDRVRRQWALLRELDE
jgi:AAA+ superfamily predicted ATPase